MKKKINQAVLEEILNRLYKELVFEPIDNKTLNLAKYIVTLYFQENEGYAINSIKCDFENNTPDIIEAGHAHIHIHEVSDKPNEEIIHLIRL